ncbi:NAD(P)H-dependent glycerol-3-phosphate dehydrogenase [Epibacterium sp. SM1979]|uniref:Glycerol-3-phosphate dehydrogenase [NAD(P)+] n=1 Tax=Tritonibacter litoralis TaxID=2662264 RepID=A0A843YES6_9RHOB|nr:NAD(P)H-dependent glycerol-3-phosphate dehydrogenase [Tritonibacter litoralis]
MSVSVLGAGAFGTALAISLGRSQPVTLWARDPDQAAEIATQRINTRRLPEAPLPEAVTVTSDFNAACASKTLLLAVPMQRLRAFLQQDPLAFRGKNLVACCKGVELSTGLGPVGVIAEVVPDAQAALLTGPSFAADIARGLPTALTLACADAVTGLLLQQELTTANLRLYRTTDTIGAEVGGALKNVFAIACGAVIGAELGDSARAALMTRGFAEMQRMAQTMGARAETLAGLSGFGDLALTCSSPLSRNFSLGLALGRGESFDPSITVEGAATARAVMEKTKSLGIDMPITQTVVALIDQSLTIADAAAQLLTRPLKEE